MSRGNPSLRFQGPERDIVSKPFDFHRGGVVETCVRYGSDEADTDAKHTCSAMDDHDGMGSVSYKERKLRLTIEVRNLTSVIDFSLWLVSPALTREPVLPNWLFQLAAESTIGSGALRMQYLRLPRDRSAGW